MVWLIPITLLISVVAFMGLMAVARRLDGWIFTMKEVVKILERRIERLEDRNGTK